METVQQTGVVAGYKVKIMLAEPKTRRSEMTGFLPGLMGGRAGLQPELMPGLGVPGAFGPGPTNAALLSSLAPNQLINTRYEIVLFSYFQLIVRFLSVKGVVCGLFSVFKERLGCCSDDVFVVFC